MPAHQTIPYLEVAAIVTGWPARTGYARAIADRFEIPVGTARSWVYYTRRRGYLPEGDADRPCRHCGGTGVVQWGATRRTAD